jgi:hypothetical protein
MSDESTILRTGASFNRAESKQDYATPWELIHAVHRRFGAITTDLAASEENKKADRFFDESANSLVQNWRELTGNLWLNPPFADISPWAEKCAVESTGGGKGLFPHSGERRIELVRAPHSQEGVRSVPISAHSICGRKRPLSERLHRVVLFSRLARLRHLEMEIITCSN